MCYVYIIKKNNTTTINVSATMIIKFRFPPDFTISSFVLAVTNPKFVVAVSKSSSISFSILCGKKERRRCRDRYVSLMPLKWRLLHCELGVDMFLVAWILLSSSVHVPLLSYPLWCKLSIPLCNLSYS